MSEQQTINRSELLVLTTEIVSAHVSNTPVDRGSLGSLIQSVFDTLNGLGTEEPTPVELTPWCCPRLTGQLGGLLDTSELARRAHPKP